MVPKKKYLRGARLVTGRELMGITTQLLDRLDKTTAYLMGMQQDVGETMIHLAVDKKVLEKIIADNMEVLDQLRGKDLDG